MALPGARDIPSLLARHLDDLAQVHRPPPPLPHAYVPPHTVAKPTDPSAAVPMLADAGGDASAHGHAHAGPPHHQPAVGSSFRQLAPASALRYSVPTRLVSELYGSVADRIVRCTSGAWQST